MAMNYEQTGRNDLHCLFNSAGTKSDSIKHGKYSILHDDSIIITLVNNTVKPTVLFQF